MATPRRRVIVSMQDGSVLEATGAWMPLPDRVAFERHFRLSAVVMGRLATAFYGSGDPEVLEHPELQGRLRPTTDPGDIREEWVAFAAWRLLRRTFDDQEQLSSFERFLEAVEDVDIEPIEEEEAGAGDPELDPTVPTPPMPS